MAGGWASLGLMPELVEAAESDSGWILPTSVQDECIPLILGGGDVLASAETGSGKTAAFALPILQLCHEHKYAKGRGKTSNKAEGKESRQTKPSLRYEMSANDRDKLLSIDPSTRGCLVQSRDVREWSGCRCTAGVSPNSTGNRFYFECTIRDEGIARVGFATADSSLNLGTDEGGYGYGGTGMKAHKGKFDPYVGEGGGEKAVFGKGDVIGCMLDFGSGDQKGSIAFSKNGVVIGRAFDLPNSSGKKGSTKKTLCLYPAVALKNAECQLNFGGPGGSEFRHPPPPSEEYRPISSATRESGGVENPRSLPDESVAPTDKQGEGPLAIVIEPTRDLAEQTYRAFADLAFRLSQPKIEAALLVGGLSPQQTLTQLKSNMVDVLVGTPPIVASYIKQGKIKTSQCNVFLLDEADQLVSKDTVDHINTIYSRLPKGGKSHSAFNRLQVCFFSATLHSREVKDLTAKICHRPLWVDLRGKNDSSIPETVHHCVVHVDPSSSFDSLDTKGNPAQTDSVHRSGKLDAKTDWSQLSSEEANSERIKMMKPHVMLELLDKFEMDQVLVFARTNLDCDLLEKFLRTAGSGNFADKDKYSCRVLAGMRSMQERQASLKAFKEGETRILIATDVAARGIDIRELPFVINMMLPDEPQTYVHRIGRVGRAERMGLAISIVATTKEYVWWCQSGKKPPCSDTRVFEKGGNCKWFSEASFLKKIESLLKQNKVNITKLDWPGLNVPAEMSALIKGKGYGDYASSKSIDPDLRAHLEELSTTVNELGVTEFALQSGYWKLKDQFNGCL